MLVASVVCKDSELHGVCGGVQLVNTEDVKDAQMMLEEEVELPLPDLLDPSNIVTDEHLRLVSCACLPTSCVQFIAC